MAAGRSRLLPTLRKAESHARAHELLLVSVSETLASPQGQVNRRECFFSRNDRKITWFHISYREAQVREMTVLFPFLPCAGETVWPPSAKIFCRAYLFPGMESRRRASGEGGRLSVRLLCVPAGRGACQSEKMVRSVRRKGGSCLRMSFRLRGGDVRSCRSTGTGKDSRRRSAGRDAQRQGRISVFRPHAPQAWPSVLPACVPV